MPGTIPPSLSIGTAEPRDAVEAFVARGDLAPTFRWTDVWQEEHASRFMVAGVAQADVLRLIRERVDDAVRQGVNPSDFLTSLQPELVRAGWWGDVLVTDPATGEQRITRFNDARLRLIYDTNLRQSYAAGRYNRARRNARRLPLLMYRTMRDERVRATHAAWDGLVLPVDHPFWEQHYPPNAWRCRCTAFALSEKDLARRQASGEKLRTTAPPDVQVPYVDPRTGDERTAPLGVDPAFAYNPGETLMQNTSALQRRALTAAPPADARALVRQIARPGGQLERMVTAPAAPLAELVPLAMRGRQPVLLGPDAVQRHRADIASDPTAPRPLTADQWSAAAQAALDDGVRLPSVGGSTYVLERGGEVVLLEVVTVTDDLGASILRVRRIRVLTPERAAADPGVQELLRRAAQPPRGTPT